MVIYKKNQVIYHYEKKGNNLTDFRGNFKNKIMQNYHKNYPKKGVMVITNVAGVITNG